MVCSTATRGRECRIAGAERWLEEIGNDQDRQDTMFIYSLIVVYSSSKCRSW